jgi:alpha-1,2-mannosyltransferase
MLYLSAVQSGLLVALFALALPEERVFFPLWVLCLAFWVLWVLLVRRNTRQALLMRSSNYSVGFFHPYAGGLGGGERVLWCCVYDILTRTDDWDVLVYSGDAADPQEIIEKAWKRFGLDLRSHLAAGRIQFVDLRLRWVVAQGLYPKFTMLLQSLGSVLLAGEALWTQPCHCFFDSTGYAFTFPLAKVLFACKVGCYVHYPTISTDMLERVSEMRPTYNNDGAISNSKTLTLTKLWYYRAFAKLYALCGYFADVKMVNSNWTRAHIEAIWGTSSSSSSSSGIHVVFPPCPTEEFAQLPLDEEREDWIVSVGQFRPEKDHILQLESMALFKTRWEEAGRGEFTPKLILIGGCRGDEDEARVDELMQRCQDMGLEENVEFVTNAPFPVLKDCLARGYIGLHCMWNEHFGIGVVEYMAAGLLTVAHESGGPRADIIDDGENGYLASSKEEYAAYFLQLFDWEVREGDLPLRIQQSAREKVARFSEEEFYAGFEEHFLTPTLLSLAHRATR